MSHVRPDELVELSSKYQLWLKPVCRLNITVQLPQLSSGKAAISTTAVVEKINKRAKLQFKSLKVTKITIDFLRLEGWQKDSAICSLFCALFCFCLFIALIDH